MKTETTVQVNYPSFLRRLIAGVIDFTILLTTSIVIGIAANAVFDVIIAREVAQLETLTTADVNKRYAEFYRLPKEQIQKLSYAFILNSLNYGLESDRINDKFSGSDNEFDIFDNNKAVQITLPSSDFKLAFPKYLAPQIMSQEKDKFLQQYGKLVYAGNPIDRFRKAFPEFKHVSDSQLAETIRHSFFTGYKESYEFNQVFGTYSGKIYAQDYSPYITILIFAYIIAYFSLSVSSKFSATFGKIALGIRVLQPNGSKLTLTKGIGYTTCFLLFSVGTFFTTFLPVVFNRNRQALHDRVCKVMLVCSDER